MAAGSYRTKVEFKSLSTTLDDLGFPTGDASTDHTEYMSARPVRANEVTRFGLESTRDTLLLSGRYSPSLAGIDSSHFCTINGVNYDIEQVDGGTLELAGGISFVVRRQRT